ncbi:hypothetical protein [Micromonospora sp. SH-82]|uniref:hypothetical protein n=1 Tax=Micromonospora sp. SH-82 TaxID=3132938 RepID=UPI003EC0A65E
MARTQFKAAGGRRIPAVVPLLAAVMAAGAALFAVGRATAPSPPAAPRYADRVVDGVPVGFPGTPRGGGDAAAAFTTSLAVLAATPADQRRQVIDQIVEGDPSSAAVPLLGAEPQGETGRSIAQTVVARVWVPDMKRDAVVPDGREVSVRLMVFSLSGTVAGAVPAQAGAVPGEDTGLAGGWYVQGVTVRWSSDRWRVVRADRPIAVPPPDQRGTFRDGSPRDTRLLSDVAGPRSWVPGTV